VQRLPGPFDCPALVSVPSVPALTRAHAPCSSNGGQVGAPRVGGSPGVGALFRAPGAVPGFDDGPGLGAGWPEGAAGVRGGMPWGGAGGVSA